MKVSPGTKISTLQQNFDGKSWKEGKVDTTLKPAETQKVGEKDTKILAIGEGLADLENVLSRQTGGFIKL